MSENGKVESPLHSLYTKLHDAGLFKNQVTFYKCILSSEIYSLESSDKFITRIKEGIRNYYKKGEGISIEDSVTLDFYRMIRGVKSRKRYDDKLELEKEYPKTSPGPGESSNIRREIVGNSNIKKTWKDRFWGKQNSPEKWIYIINVAWILQYYSLFPVKNNLIKANLICKNKRNELTNNPLRYDYVEYYSPNTVLLEKINGQINLNKERLAFKVKSFMDLANYIFDVLIEQCDFLNAISINDFKECIAKAEKGRIRDLNTERVFFERNIDIYGRLTKDRFNMLEKHKDNLFCSFELGMIYIEGNVYKLRKQIQELSHDYKKSLEYFSSCTVSDGLYYRAAYQIAKMIFDGRIEFDTEERHNNTEKYIDMCGDFKPAKHLKAKVYKEKADELYLSLDQKQRIIEFENNSKLSRTIILYYTMFLENEVEAFDNGNGWIYAGNGIAEFLLDEKNYGDVIPYLEYKDVKKLNAEDILLCLSEGGNLWSKTRLAQFYMQDGKALPNSDKGNLAKKLLEEASSENYSSAAYYLAKYFYNNKNSKDKYRSLLIQSADAGYYQAKEALLKLHNSLKK